MAKPIQDKQRFVELRAAGYSYRQIAAELDISISTCSAWAEELAAEVDILRESELEELYQVYAMSKAARIKAFGKFLKKIDDAIDEKDLTELSARDLLELRMKYSDKLTSEFKEPMTENDYARRKYDLSTFGF